MQTIAGLSISVAMTVLFSGALMFATDESERTHCQALQLQAKSLAGFFISANEKETCDFYHIAINAPVR